MQGTEEVVEELEALEAVYFNEVEILSVFPPKLRIKLNPLTADDATLQVQLGLNTFAALAYAQ